MDELEMKAAGLIGDPDEPGAARRSKSAGM
jgi:hypothetical protein